MRDEAVRREQFRREGLESLQCILAVDQCGDGF